MLLPETTTHSSISRCHPCSSRRFTIRWPPYS